MPETKKNLTGSHEVVKPEVKAMSETAEAGARYRYKQTHTKATCLDWAAKDKYVQIKNFEIEVKSILITIIIK